MDFFTLELDTTGPIITIAMPTYTSKDSYNEISVLSNEMLSEYQNFYFIDSKGNRHDVIFSFQGDNYVGSVRFNDFSDGIATFYATVKDEVNNTSSTKTSTINVYSNNAITKIGLVQRNKDIRINTRNKFIKISDRNIALSLADRKVNISTEKRRITLGLEVVKQ